MTLRAMLAAWILRPKCRASAEESVLFLLMNRIPAQKQSHTVARFDCDQQSCREDEARGGHFHTNLYGMCRFSGYYFSA